jgi:hypothetical protein
MRNNFNEYNTFANESYDILKRCGDILTSAPIILVKVLSSYSSAITPYYI